MCSIPLHLFFETLTIKISGHRAIFVLFQGDKTLHVSGLERLQRPFREEPGSFNLVAYIYHKLHLLHLQLEYGHLSSYLCLSSFSTYLIFIYFSYGTYYSLHCVIIIVHIFKEKTVMSRAHDLSVSFISVFLSIFISLPPQNDNTFFFLHFLTCLQQPHITLFCWLLFQLCP